MRRLLIALAVAGATLVGAGSAAARSAHIAGVTAAMQSHANAEVAQAQAEGSAFAKALADQVFVHHLPGNQVTPEQAALATALFNAGTQVGGNDPTVPPPAAGSLTPNVRTAHAAGCWGNRRSEVWHTIAGGAQVEDEWVDINGWCGNGSVITSTDWYYFHHWSQWPYCYANADNVQGWDGSYSWTHGGVSQSNGFTTTISCANIFGSMHAVQRNAANGYSDHYNDIF